METYSSSSWASDGGSSTEVTSTANEKELVVSYLTSASPCVAADDIVVGSHRFTFDCYSRREDLGVGKYLVSDTFTSGGYDWAITLYPNGRKEKYKEYISIYIRLESDATDVNALFELILVDQSGNNKHIIRTRFGGLQEERPFLMSRRRTRWGFGQYTKKRNLKKSGYLAYNCLVVDCKVGVLEDRTEKNILRQIRFIFNQLSSSIKHQNIVVCGFQGMKNSNCEDTKLPDLKSVAKLITELESPLQLQGLINHGDRIKFDQYLYAVDKIQQSIKTDKIYSYETQRAHAIKTLQLVFKGILNCSIQTKKSDSLSKTVYSSSITGSYGYELQGSNHTDHGELSSEQVYRLQSIVEMLHSTGCLGDCIEVYIISRRSLVDARFLRFCIGKWTANDLKSLGCEDFAAKIRIWILAAYKFYDDIFPGEKQYYEQIFDKLRAVTYDNCFLPIVKHVAIQLNNFADAVSSTASFQKLFSVLELYKTLIVILPKIKNMVVHSESFADIFHSANNTTDSLPNLIRKLILCFENTVLNEQLNCLPSTRLLHLLTEYTMNYVANILLYKELLTNIIVSRPTKSLGNQADDNFLEASDGTPLGLHIIWIMMSLRINLEGKSSFCEDSSLRYIFLMNNVGYITSTIKESSELLEMIGRDYLLKLKKDVLQIAEEYISSISQRVLYCLRDDGLNYKFPFFNRVSKKSLKKRFKTFNAKFEEVCLTHSYMLDMQLASQLDQLILCKWLPTYKSFLEKYSRHLQFERYRERYIKYSSENL
ncbi:exocyst complex component EXO70C1-like [Apium graveolens]|uniref:exocyst complex component EXO70C1-like n=1 Tax=Apium graveolens TaxID=4045 RepID=UPI003D793972